MPTTVARPRVSEGVLDLPAEGRNLRPGTFGDQLDPMGTLVVFLRHLGCPFCRECVGELGRASARGPMPPVVFVHPATVAEGDDLFRAIAPDARAVADPDAALYRGFGLARGGVGMLLNPTVLACGIRAVRQGYGGGKVRGDVWRMPGFFLVRDGEVIWEHRARHAGDHPDFANLPAELAALA